MLRNTTEVLPGRTALATATPATLLRLDNVGPIGEWKGEMGRHGMSPLT